MQNTMIIVLALTFLLGCAGCAKTVDDAIDDNASFSGVVTEVKDGLFIMEADGEDGVKGAVSVATRGLDAPELCVGDQVTVNYDGLMCETYPMQPNQVYAVLRDPAGVRS